MTLNLVNPVEIQRNAAKGAGKIRARSMAFGDFLAGVSAMTPFATEFTQQATGNTNAATVLNAAFASFPAAASAFAGGGAAPSYAASPYGYAPSLPYGASTTLPGIGADYPSTQNLVGGGQAVPGTNLSQAQLMDIMNQNNLRLIELQAIMQSNMQTWNTKSNILSADHRAKMSMIEKFTARG